MNFIRLTPFAGIIVIPCSRPQVFLLYRTTRLAVVIRLGQKILFSRRLGLCPYQLGGLGGGDVVGLGDGSVLVFRLGVAGVCLAGLPSLGLLPTLGGVGMAAGGG